MKIDILTIFPDMFAGPFSESMIKRAVGKKIVDINIHNLRQWSTDPHQSVDDRPYGGGPGMIMMVEPIERALKDLRSQDSHVILTSAKGTPFNQSKAQELSHLSHLIFICGHYEGVDQRVGDYLVDEELSIGDYVLTGGELPAMVMIDSTVRLIPNVLGHPDSHIVESHTISGYLEYPQYTRPDTYDNWKVPKILLSGNHAQIKLWQTEHSSVK
jgi:tRNA (guanine37-N1)-methyltransferase